VDTTEAVERDHRPWWLPLRSAFGLALLLVGLGVSVAALLGLAALGLAALFDQALG
jgi:hypothetical protein